MNVFIRIAFLLGGAGGGGSRNAVRGTAAKRDGAQRGERITGVSGAEGGRESHG